MKIKHLEKRRQIVAETLTELSKREGMTLRNAHKRKDLFVEIVIPHGMPDENGNRKTRLRFANIKDIRTILEDKDIQ